jgi:hypothetical protein
MNHIQQGLTPGVKEYFQTVEDALNDQLDHLLKGPDKYILDKEVAIIIENTIHELDELRKTPHIVSVVTRFALERTMFYALNKIYTFLKRENAAIY